MGYSCASCGTPVTRYLHGHQLIKQYRNSINSYYVYNGHGDTVRLIIDASGSFTLAQYNYDAFGKVLYKIELGVSNTYLYAGYQYDTEMEQYYLRARYYTPNTGRFISKDPYWTPENSIDSSNPSYFTVVQSNNLYVYCNSNPIFYTDPSGLAPGDKFGSANEAAIDCAKYIGWSSINNDWEYASYIYYYTTGGSRYYSYTSPATDKLQGKVNYIDNPNQSLFKNTGKTFVAFFHTHAAFHPWYNSEQFSKEDIYLLSIIVDIKAIYVATPGGALKKAWKTSPTSSTYVTEVIPCTIPKDSNFRDYRLIKENGKLVKIYQDTHPNSDLWAINQNAVLANNSILTS